MRSIVYRYFDFFRSLHESGDASIHVALLFFSVFSMWFAFAGIAVLLLMVGVRFTQVIPNPSLALVVGGLAILFLTYFRFGSPEQLARLKSEFQSESKQQRTVRRWLAIAYTVGANAAFAVGLYAVWLGRTN